MGFTSTKRLHGRQPVPGLSYSLQAYDALPLFAYYNTRNRPPGNRNQKGAGWLTRAPWDRLRLYSSSVAVWVAPSAQAGRGIRPIARRKSGRRRKTRSCRFAGRSGTPRVWRRRASCTRANLRARVVLDRGKKVVFIRAGEPRTLPRATDTVTATVE